MFQFVMVLYGVPGFLYMFYFKNAKSNLDFVPKICYLGSMDIKIISIYNFYSMGGQA